MEKDRNMYWKVGSILANVSWKKGECLEGPVITTNDGVSWRLDFYPAGDEDTEGFVFWLNRSNADKAVEVIFEIHFCFLKTPVRQYMLQHIFEIGEEVHKWMIDDVKTLAQLKIYIPTSAFCIIGYLTVKEKRDSLNPLDSDKKDERNRTIL